MVSCLTSQSFRADCHGSGRDGEEVRGGGGAQDRGHEMVRSGLGWGGHAYDRRLDYVLCLLHASVPLARTEPS